MGVKKQIVRHVFSKGNVCNKVSRGKGVRGVVDQDPLSVQPSYIESIGSCIENKRDILLFKDKINDNYIIMLCPTLEGWILKAAKAEGIKPAKYGLPDKEKELHKIVNINLQKLEQLVNDLKQQSLMLKTLKNYLIPSFRDNIRYAD